jgi:hypothetical protein
MSSRAPSRVPSDNEEEDEEEEDDEDNEDQNIVGEEEEDASRVEMSMKETSTEITNEAKYEQRQKQVHIAALQQAVGERVRPNGLLGRRRAPKTPSTPEPYSYTTRGERISLVGSVRGRVAILVVSDTIYV